MRLPDVGCTGQVGDRAGALIVIRTAVLPRWLGWSAALAAALSFAAVVVAGMAFVAWLVVQIWLMGTSIALLRQVNKPQSQAFSAPACGS